MIQRDLDGDPFLQHRTCSKWKLFGPNQPVSRPELTRPLRRSPGGTPPSLDGRDLPCARTVGAGAGRGSGADRLSAFAMHTSNGDGRLSRVAAGWSNRRGAHRARAALGRHRARRPTLCSSSFPGRGLWLSFCVSRTEAGAGPRSADTGFDARLVAEEEWRTWPHANGERVLPLGGGRDRGASRSRLFCEPALTRRRAGIAGRRSRCSIGCSTTFPTTAAKLATMPAIASLARRPRSPCRNTEGDPRRACELHASRSRRPSRNQSTALHARLLAGLHGGHSRATDAVPLFSSRPSCRATAATASPCGQGFFSTRTPSASPSTWPSSLSREGPRT